MNKTIVITVSGTRSGAGKTRLVEKLVPCLKGCAVVKARPEEGAEFSVVEEQPGAGSAGKDTGRFLDAGARRAYLISGRRDEVRRAIEGIVASGEFDVVLVESNAMALELESNLSFFVKDDGPPKADAEVCEERADVIVHPGGEEEMMSEEGKAKVAEELRKESQDGRVTCPAAFEIADRLGVSRRLVGEVANSEHIKITACQLGCF